MQGGGPLGLGARVEVAWSDGRSYGGVVSAWHAGWVQVRWDAGGASAWVPAPHVRPMSAPMAGAPAAPPMGWGWQAPPGPQAGPPPAGAAPPHAGAAPPHAGAGPAQAASPKPAATAAPNKPARSEGPPPTRMRTAGPGDLPRGLVYEPTRSGSGSGKAFFVCFGFVTVSERDLAMRMTDIDHLGDDVAALRASGYRVIVDLCGDREGLDLALKSEHPDAVGAQTVGVLWSSHGNEDGSVSDHDGGSIAPEDLSTSIAQKATVRLFVMSACHAGKHSNRWQKTLGPQALVIGWGAPITNERAVDFLTPDDASSKDFDDLLVRHLGVPRVIADGPLVEVKELAEAHERELPGLRLSHEDLVKKAIAFLDVKAKPGKGRDVFVGIRAPRAKGSTGPIRTQVVRIAPQGVQDEFVHLSTMIGPYSEALDLPRALREMVDTMRTRLILVKTAPNDTEFVAAESLQLRRGLDHVTLGRIIMQVGVVGDRLEDLFFGSDRY